MQNFEYDYLYNARRTFFLINHNVVSSLDNIFMLLWYYQLYFTGDYPGIMERTIKNQTGGEVLFLNGALGCIYFAVYT